MDAKLPGSFKHVKIQQNVHRCNILSENDVVKWIAEYSKETNSGWIIKFHASAPSRFLSRHVFACHHTSYRRLAAEKNKRGNSKNTDCKAEIEIKIKITTKSTQRSDVFIKDGMPAILTFKGNHNHSQNTVEALSFLKPSEDMRETFNTYFSNGLTVTQAINLHESKLKTNFLESGKEMANSSINPKYRTVQHWYNVWFAKNLGPRSGYGMIDKVTAGKEYSTKDDCSDSKDEGRSDYSYNSQNGNKRQRIECTETKISVKTKTTSSVSIKTEPTDETVSLQTEPVASSLIKIEPTDIEFTQSKVIARTETIEKLSSHIDSAEIVAVKLEPTDDYRTLKPHQENTQILKESPINESQALLKFVDNEFTQSILPDSGENFNLFGGL